jgi:hypothetical protein
MRQLICIFVGIVLIQGCWAQKNVAIQDLPPAVGLFVELATNHFIDKQWRKANITSIFHPNDFGLTDLPRYKGIPEIEPIVYDGQALFLTSKVGQVMRDRAWVDVTKRNEELEDALFVRIDYSVIATMAKDGKIRILDQPVSVRQYIILAVDTDDGKQKVIGVYPRHEQFIGAKYFLENFEDLSGEKNLKDELKKAVGN